MLDKSDNAVQALHGLSPPRKPEFLYVVPTERFADINHIPLEGSDKDLHGLNTFRRIVAMDL